MANRAVLWHLAANVHWTMNVLRRLFLAVVLSLGCAGARGAAKSEVSLLLSHEAARPGETLTAGVKLRMPEGWHSYWEFAGDSGEATRVDWTLPAGWKAGAVLWPVPEKLVQAGFTTYVYHREVVLLVPLTIPSNAASGVATLKARVAWQECELVCVLGKSNVQASLTIGPETKPSANQATLELWRGKLPVPQAGLAVKARWEKSAQDNPRPLVLEWPATRSVGAVDFFSLVGGDFSVKGETEVLSAAPPAYRLRKLVEKSAGDWPRGLSGLLLEQGETRRGIEAKFAVGPADGRAVAPANPPAVAPAPGSPVVPPAPARSLPVILLFAFLGGLILNVMPCVLPVIALKIFSFVSQSKETPARVRSLGLVYGLGVLASFAILALAAIAVRQAGGDPSWGMLLQNQIFRVLLTILMTLVALNLFGVFAVTMSGRVMGAAGDLAAREGLGGAFFNGMLATVLATPCVAPFMSVALAFAFVTPSAAITLLVFLAIGLGLAAPFVALCWQPAWLKLLPRPGAWMEHFKVAMGFPMLATAVWLFWFTAPRFGKSGVLWLGLFLVVLAAAAWVWGQFVQKGRRRIGLAVAVSLLLVASGYAFILEGQLDWRTKVKPASLGASLRESPDGIDWQPWSPQAVTAAREQGRPVLVDFTADNCLNCQVNKRTSLEIPSTRAKLREINAVALLGDFSDESPLIAAELRRYNRPGVPLVLVYPRSAGAPPIVLPELLTPQIVLNALEQAAK